MMSAEKSHIPIRQLAEVLKDAVANLDEGNLKLDDLETLVAHARDLHERLVVLRHFAYQQSANSADEEAAEATAEIPFSIGVSDTDEAEIAAADVHEEVEMAPEEVPLVKQTSLIDAIEELSEEEEKSLADKFAEEQEEVSLADKLVRAPIADLAKAITLNQKFIFISELFGDAERYDQAIQLLKSCSGLDAAMVELQKWADQDTWQEGDSADEFKDLVQRRYIDSNQE